MDYKKAIEEIKLRRKNALLANEQQIISALRSNDDLRKIDIEIRSIQQSLRTDGDKSADSSASLNRLSALQKQRGDMFKQIGISETVPYFCNSCQDTGINESGKPCSCLISLTAESESPLFSFKDSDLSIFKPDDREKAEKVYKTMLAFCQRFPDTNKKNLVLLGKTGTGKTFLASCVADYLTENGYSVIFISAFDFVNRMLKYHTAPTYEKLEYLLPLIDCDLLIIDDLGTESLFRNVTVEYLYSVFNERTRQNKHFMITTNLDQEGLSERYGERILSRLADNRLSAWIVLAENDLRRR